MKHADITARQIVAARALLEFTQADLAALAGVALASLKRFEVGKSIPTRSTKSAIVEALEEAGVKFIPGGVKLT